MPRRINVKLSDELFDKSEALTKRKGETLSDLIRDALDLELLFDETLQDETGRVLVERNDVIRPIVLR